MRRLFSTDKDAGITRYWRHNPADDVAYIETEQDITGIIEANKRAFNDAESGWGGDMHHVATLPLTVITKLKREKIIDPENDPKGIKFMRWLNLSENRAFRTKPGRV
jgi:hypothetical protein